MKKIIQACGLIVFSLLLPADLFGQLDNLANMSAEWVRTGNRNASVDGADIVNYNPSGLTILDDGFHINFGNQMLIRNPRHTFDLGFGENTYSHEGMDMLLPNFYAVYKKYRLAIYAGAYVAGGGGAIEYPEGSISTNLIAQQISDNLQIPYNYFKNQNLSGSSYYKAVTAGGTYKLNNLISFSAGGRYINAIKNTVVGMTIEGVGNLPDNEIGIDIEDNASGFGGVFGLTLAPSREVNLSIHYETRVKLDFKTTVNEDDTGEYSGEELNRRDLPAAIYLGMHIQMNDEVWLEGNFNYYYQTMADWGKTTDDMEWSNIAGDSYKAGMAFGYQLGIKTELSFGGVFTGFKYDDKEKYFTRPGTFEVLKYGYLTLNTGIGYSINEKIRLNIGIARSIWKKNSIVLYDSYDISVRNGAWIGAIGLNINLFGKNEEKGIYYY